LTVFPYLLLSPGPCVLDIDNMVVRASEFLEEGAIYTCKNSAF